MSVVCFVFLGLWTRFSLSTGLLWVLFVSKSARINSYSNCWWSDCCSAILGIPNQSLIRRCLDVLGMILEIAKASTWTKKKFANTEPETHLGLKTIKRPSRPLVFFLFHVFLWVGGGGVVEHQFPYDPCMDWLMTGWMDCLTPDWCIAWLMNDGLMLQPFEASNILVMAICFLMELPLHHHYFRRIFSISIPVYMSEIPRSFKSFNHFFQTDVVPSNQIAIFRKTQGGPSCCQMLPSFILQMWSHAREMGFSAASPYWLV